MHLHDRRSLGPREMMHPGGHPHETSRVDELTFCRIERVAHSGAERAAHDGHVFIGRMPMRAKLATVGQFKPHDEGSAGFEGISVEDRGLRTWESWAVAVPISGHCQMSQYESEAWPAR